MAEGSVLVVGSANMDLVSRAERLPRLGETLIGSAFSTHPGGKGANQAVAIGRLGGSCLFCGCVGDDDLGNSLKMSLIDAGVSCASLEVRMGASGTASIWVDRQGMNSIIVVPGANSLVSPEQVRLAIQNSGSRIVLVQLEIPLDAVAAAASHAEFLILNPAPACALPDEILAKCEVLTPNETELEALTGIRPDDAKTCTEAGRFLLDRGVRHVVITLGSRGSYWVSAAGGASFPAPPVAAIDTTAAGDAFNGALAMFLSQGREMANAIALANCVGALSTTKRGAQEAMPTMPELRELAGSLL